MAGDEDKADKTEQPTQRKLEDARKKGEAPRSQEVAGWFILAAALLLLAGASGPAARSASDWLRIFLEQPHLISAESGAAQRLLASIGWRVTGSLGLVFLVLTAAALAGHLVQAAPVFAIDKIQPKLSKISPMEGLKRLFGAQAWVNFFKGVAKLTIVSVACFMALWPRRDLLLALPNLDLAALLGVAREASIALMIAALIAYAMIAVLDYAWQRHSFLDRMKMSRRELKDEMKNTEGDPHVRAKLRQIRMERGRRRMLARVPEATVVITNPTHYAIALRYERGETAAPICVAKGVDEVAARIREIAKAANVPFVEDPPLARALHAAAELDQPIPEVHYQAVAKIIGHILALSQRRAARRPSAPRGGIS
jgi:flagellar biosynthetic protein FlhB